MRHKRNLDFMLHQVSPFFIDTDQEAEEFPNQCYGISGAAIFVADKYCVGLDLKMNQEAKVLCFYKDVPDVEEMLQKLGRGSRDMTAKLGTVFIQKPAEEAQLLKDKFDADESHDWHDGAKILKYLNWIKAMPNMPDQKWARENLSEQWIADFENYFVAASPEWKASL